MANDLSYFEDLERRAFGEGESQVGEAGRNGLIRLLNIAARSPESKEFVVIFLLAGVAEAERHGAAGEVPEDERRVWESIGANFSNSEAPARSAARAARAFAELVQRSIRGDDAVARFLGVGQSRVSQRVTARSLYAFVDPRGQRCFPRWQFADNKPLQGLQPVMRAIGPDIHPLVIDHWATTPDQDLMFEGEPLSPVDWLRTGGSPDRLLELVPSA